MKQVLWACCLIHLLSPPAIGQQSYGGNVISCAESVMMVALEHYEIDYSIDDIRNRLRPGMLGEVPISRLRDGFESFGLVANSVQGDISKFDRPGELFVGLVELEPGDEVGHFVLLMRRSDGHFDIYDAFQSNRPVTVTEQVLSEYWTGLAIILCADTPSDGLGIKVVVLLLGAAGIGYVGSQFYQSVFQYFNRR